MTLSPVAMGRGREVRFDADQALSKTCTRAAPGVFLEYRGRSFSNMGGWRGLGSTWSDKAALFREALLSLLSQGGG